MKNPKRIIIASLPGMGKTLWSDMSEFATEVDIRNYANRIDWQIEYALVARAFCYEAPFRGIKPHEWYSWLYINIAAHPLVIDELYKRDTRMIVVLPKNFGTYELVQKCVPEEKQDKDFLKFLDNGYKDFVKSLEDRKIPIVRISGKLKDNFNNSGSYGKLLSISEARK